VARTVPPLRASRRRLLLWLILAVAALALIFGALAGFYIDILWFREIGLSSVFWTRFWARAILAVVFGAVFFIVLYANLLIVRRFRPRYRVFSPEEEIVERYRAAFEPYVRWVIPGIALLFAAFAAAGVASQWESYQLWRASGDISMGITDPLFGRDAAFYLLSLPFQQFVQGWLFTSLVVIAVVTAAAHYLWGGIRLRSEGERFTPQVKAHLSVLLGLIVLVHAWGYRLGQFDLLTSERGVVTGASYTDVNAHLPALRFLVVVAILCALLFLINIRFRGWALPALGLGILALTSVVGGAAVPAFVQRFSVGPQELQRERPFIERNIELTRRAYSIDDVEIRQFQAEPTFDQEELDAASTTVDNIRLWNPDIIKRSYLQLQRLRPFYEFEDVDVDRYVVDGERRTVMIAPREINQTGIPGGGQTWQNLHLFYTHGYAATASRVDEVTAEGAPSFILSDIPPAGPLAGELAQPAIYFEEESEVPFVMVGADSDEFDFPLGQEGGQTLTRYEGEGGISMSGFFRRLAFAWRYRDVNLLISGLINEDSRMLINLGLPDRVQRIAPFLSYDFDPYAAIVDGRLVWIWDAYTTSDRFPYSEQAPMQLLTTRVTDEGIGVNETLPEEGNYIRNSVKVAVDAYDGTTTFYTVDEGDPIIQAWQRVFPDLFTPSSEAPEELQQHFRYPEDLFRIQSDRYANYHVTDPVQFYAKGDFWTLPQVVIDPTEQARTLEPYYLLLPLPGETEARFILFSPFTPASRPNMVSWLAANSDPEAYGDLVAFEFGGRNVIGPGQAAALMHQDTDVSRETSLLDQRGSNVIYGDVLVIPIGQGFVYVQPLYTESEQTGQGIPEMKRVIVVNGQNVIMRNTLGEALAEAVGQLVPPEEPTEPGEPTEPTEPAGDVASLLAQAQQHFEAAQAALEAGDLATYQAETEAAQAAVAQAAALAGVPTPAPSPTGGGEGEGGGGGGG
jgi:uncharacterized membrane protein (UPF0182 family)